MAASNLTTPPSADERRFAALRLMRIVSDLRENTVKLDDLKKEELPKDLQDLPREQQLEKIQKIGATGRPRSFNASSSLEILVEQLPQVIPVVFKTATESAVAPILT
jgi:hypothetical protein